MLWVFSGGRGVHLWISDDEFMNFDKNDRKNLMDFLSISNIGSKSQTFIIDSISSIDNRQLKEILLLLENHKEIFEDQ